MRSAEGSHFSALVYTVNFAESVKFCVSIQQFCQCELVQVRAKNSRVKKTPIAELLSYTSYPENLFEFCFK